MAKYGGGFGGGMNMQSIMQQARKMQEQMANAQEELENDEISGEAGGGLVSVIVNGYSVMKSISIKPEAVDPDDIEMLEDLILSAYKIASEKASKIKEDKLPSQTAGLI